MSILSEAIKLFNSKNYEEALSLFLKAKEIFGEQVVKYHIEKCKKELQGNTLNNPKRVESKSKGEQVLSSRNIEFDEMLKAFHDLQGNIERSYSIDKQLDLKLSVKDINEKFRRKEYLASLIEYSKYNSDFSKLSNLLNIQKNIELSLKNLGVIDKNRPFVSVIIPVHNVESYLARCLESVLNQTLENIQVILIDDGSSDKSLSIMQEYAKKDSRIIIISNSQASGNSGSPRNQALYYASGEYICFVDADDYIDSNMLFDLYYCAIENNSDICTSNGFYREEDGKETEVVILPDVDYRNRQEVLKVSQFPIIWYRIYKRDFLLLNKIQLGTFRVSADVIFSLKALLLANNIAKVDKVYYHYNFARPGSTIERRRGEQVLDLFKSYEAIMRFLQENKLDSYYSLIINKFIGDYFYCKKNMQEQVMHKFEDFSSVFAYSYLNLAKDRRIISEYSNKTLDNLYSKFSVDKKEVYNNFLKKVDDEVDISVIVPVHNLELYLEKSLKSIMNQKFKNIEIIAVDDGSSDSSQNILEKLAKQDNRLKITTINQASGYPGVVRNIGMVISKGKYINFVDGDDWIDGEFLSRLYEPVKKESPDVIYSRAYFREEPDGISRKFNFNVPKIETFNTQNRINLVNSAFFSNVWGRLYKKSFLVENKIGFPRMYVSEDLSFSLLTSFLANSISVADTQGYHYRYNRENSTTKLRTGVSALKQIYSHNEFINFIDSYGINKDLRLYAIAKKVNSYFYTYNRIEDKELKAYFKSQVKELLKG